ncbi:hypothetical protein F6R98_10480 [Candidatus Methylospira mobilis]|uniref:Uncharacterized protein n=1 Tax=Candidatus Methylospira mobilis TaxID=1808979 RepID=A0A5Q0BLJ3_9GAMM|nr:hypothetical protein [Candidatus Methylospira mobilis]QFY42988.1 hypothetical protein F6R98_10480 [Candidatus Methylospira mobilis]
MLSNVPTAINKMTRKVIKHHPNAYNCQIFRKAVNRPDPQMGGIPTLGGIGVLDTEDEEDISWEWIANGYSMTVESFQPSPMMSRQDANNGDTEEYRFLIVPEDDAADLQLKKHDVVYLLLGEFIRLAYEIVGIETVINIPPYAMRYVMNRRDDLHMVGQSAW